jgi:hypothetical protein
MNKKEDWVKEFQTFIYSNEISPSNKVSSDLLSIIQADLNPSIYKLFVKLILTHFIIGTLILFICPQFEISLFNGLGLTAIFMHFGEVACSLACGAVFLGSSAFATSLFFKPEEIRIIKKSKFLVFSLLSILSIGVFISVGATVVISLGLAWIIGSIAGGLISFELGWILRLKQAKV